jgi:hypothetical protein
MGKGIRTVALIALFALSGASIYGYSTYGPTQFDPDVWRAGERAISPADAPRARIADGLVRSRSLIGKSRAEIDGLLGPETKTDKFDTYDLVYWLGPERGFVSIDSEWLVIDFDQRGSVVTAEIVRD